jgi:hypothetical protein
MFLVACGSGGRTVSTDPQPSDSTSDIVGGPLLQVVTTAVKVDREAGAPRLSFEVLVFDEAGDPLLGLDANGLALRADGKDLAGTWTVRGFREAGGTVELAVLIPNHQSYTDPVELGENLTWTAIKAVMEGVTAVVAAMPNRDRVATYMYDDHGVAPYAPWQSRETALDALQAIPDGPPGRPEIWQLPRFYQALDTVAQSFGPMMTTYPTLPTRRIVLSVTDGKDTLHDDVRAVDRAVHATIDGLNAQRVLPWFLGFTLDVPDTLVQMHMVASKTDGRYQEVAPEDWADLTDRIIRFGTAINSGFVITFTPAPGTKLLDTVRELRLTIDAGNAIGRDFVHQVKVAP